MAGQKDTNFLRQVKDWDATKPTILVTGGVHGYETSGVQGTPFSLHCRS